LAGLIIDGFFGGFPAVSGVFAAFSRRFLGVLPPA
jgi:hypothetical protein